MADENKTKIENKEQKEEHKHEHGEHEHTHEHAHEHEGHSHETKAETKPAETKKEKVKQVISKKDEAVALGLGLQTSKKHCMYICRFIKYKKIDDAIKMLEDVIKMKRAVPYKGEIPHRSEMGMMSGRYPVKASKLVIPVLKALKGNAIVNQMDIDKTIISEGISNWGSRPSRSGGRRGKRVNLILKARETTPKNKESKEKKGEKK